MMGLDISYSVDALKRVHRMGVLEKLGPGFAYDRWDAELRALIKTLTVLCANEDDLPVLPLSNNEIVLRSIRWVLLSELARLEQAINTLVPKGPREDERELWRERLPGVLVVRAEVAAVTSSWLVYRDHSRPEYVRDPVQYAVALAKGLSRLRRLDQVADAERLLYRGVASTHQTRILSHCEIILSVLGCSIDIDREQARIANNAAWDRRLARR